MDRPSTFSNDAKRGEGAHLVSADALFSLIGDDPEIKAKIRLLINMMLENAFRTMLSGTTKERTDMSRALMPSIIKMTAQNQTGPDALRAQMEKMFAEMRGELEEGTGS